MIELEPGKLYQTKKYILLGYTKINDKYSDIKVVPRSKLLFLKKEHQNYFFVYNEKIIIMIHYSINEWPDCYFKLN